MSQSHGGFDDSRRRDRMRGDTAPSLMPSFVPASKETSEVMTSVESPAPHRGWHSRGYVPHWDHPGMIQSVNFRLADSLPSEMIRKWQMELGLLAESAGLQPGNSSSGVAELAGKDASAPYKEAGRTKREIQLRRRIEEYLDAGHGACWLRRPQVAALVEGALRRFDDERYRLLAWCIMPNHVHSLIETKEGFPLAEVLHSWKSFSSNKANKLLGRRGEFWQREYFDRYVRNAEHYAAVIAYIEENPVKARLVRWRTEWTWSSARFRTGSAGIPVGE